jgi:hypothetical protein
MKIIILFTLIIISCISQSSYSQSSVGYGVKIGGSGSIFSIKEYPGTQLTIKNKFGINGGVFVDFFDDQDLILENELFFYQKPVTLQVDELSNSKPTYEFDYRLDLLVYGIKAKYKFLRKEFKPFVATGFLANLYLGSNLSNPDSILSASDLVQIEENTKKLYFGIIFTVGFEVKTEYPFSIISEFNFIPDITYFYEDPKNNTSAKIKSFDFRIGIKF